MDVDYFMSFSAEEICAHIRMSARLKSRDSIEIQITPRPEAAGEFNIVIVGFDYLSEFSIFCGLLSAYGLDIHSGDIYSYASEGSFKKQRKIVDVFYVGSNLNAPFDAARQQSFSESIRKFARLLAAG